MPVTVIENIGLLATPVGRTARSSKEQRDIQLRQNAWLAFENGVITAIGEGRTPAADAHIDACGKLVTPGLVDPHTHLVFGGWRQHELAMKLKGVTYLEILAAGGGILSTVNKTRAASMEELADKAEKELEKMLRLGVTTCECKSGYGLCTQEELKMLRTVELLKARQPVELVSTFMAAHALPVEYSADREGYIRLIIDEMLPRVAEEHLAEFCDVFCETGVFTPDECRRILLAAQQLGLAVKCHSDEIDPIGGTEMAGSIGAVSCEHLIRCQQSGIEAMKNGGTVACLLPATSFYLGATFAPARQMIDAGVPVAFGSDFNPGSCPCSNLPLAMNIGCYRYRMTPEECLTAVTLNAAAAIHRADRLGTLEVGKQADILIWDAPDLEYVFYRFGDSLADTVIKNGAVV